MTLSLPTNWNPDHAPTAAELEQVLAVIRGTWTTYTPSWTGSSVNPAIGNGTITGRYCYLNATTIKVIVKLVFGSTSTKGTGGWRISLPLTAADSAGFGAVGQWLANDSGSALRGGGVTFISTTTVEFWYDGAPGAVGSTGPFAGTFSSSNLYFSLDYQIA